ncbi:MAG: NUDIX hydrolase [bacterium]|nr:NUDIX hydrolase [bacterium]
MARPDDVGYSADCIVQRSDGKILVGQRGHEPWRNTISVCIGGHGSEQEADVTPLHTALREVQEETGLAVDITRLLGIYGPGKRTHAYLRYDQADNRYWAESNDQPAHQYNVLAFVFAATVTGGKLADSEEMSKLRWVNPEELVGIKLAFDHAKPLAEILSTSSPTENGLHLFI